MGTIVFPMNGPFEEHMDCVIELSSFCLVEPITLGFFPYQTEEGTETFGTGSEDVSNDGNFPSSSSASTDQELRGMVKGLAKETTDLHRHVAE